VSGGAESSGAESSGAEFSRFAFAAEARALGAALGRFPAAWWSLPTACAPWTVAELAAHVEIAVRRVETMLDDAQPLTRAGQGPLVSPADYYRPDERFGAASNADRVAVAQSRAAALGSGAVIAAALIQACDDVSRRCVGERPDRLVRTRHGDPMLLDDFLTTRVVELVVHGFDLALAVGAEPWTSDAGSRAVLELLADDGGRRSLDALEIDATTFLLKATGRAPFTDEENRRVDLLGLRLLTLG
jgi:uncharacterized protein (TIGR03083 family)